MAMIDTLREAGLADSEAKVYLALLEAGTLTKTPLVKHTGISPSKVYEVVDKLKRKGLISVVVRNGVQTFTAAPPIKIKEYLEGKKRAIAAAEANVDDILPKLLALSAASAPHIDITVYTGWEGASSAYTQLAMQLKRHAAVYVIGASAGSREERTQRFFMNYVEILEKKEAVLHVIFKEEARAYAKPFLARFPRTYRYNRFLFTKSLAELTVTEDTVHITSLEEEPFVIRIRNPQCADLFKQYFEKLWDIAKP